MTDYDVTLEVSIKVRVADDIVIRRVLENHDDEGHPQPRADGGPGWQDMFYALPTSDDVVFMLAHNLGIQGRRLSNLDGWADLPDTAADAWIDDISTLDVREIA